MKNLLIICLLFIGLSQHSFAQEGEPLSVSRNAFNQIGAIGYLNVAYNVHITDGTIGGDLWVQGSVVDLAPGQSYTFIAALPAGYSVIEEELVVYTYDGAFGYVFDLSNSSFMVQDPNNYGYWLRGINGSSISLGYIQF